jgi:lipopolysaccharide assembly outer membrane protein LptD (OstA)
MAQEEFRKVLKTVFVGGIFSLALLVAGGHARAQTAPAPPVPPSAPSTGAPQGNAVMVGGKPMHVSANRSLRDIKRNRLELFGNVYVRRPAELLTADYAVLDLNTERIVAEGNAAYFTAETVIYGSKMDFNYILGTGTIENGRVESEHYQLIGEELERLGEDDYMAKNADYSTCKDCPNSWKIHGRTIRLTLEGYARISNMVIKVNDAPVLYFPFLIVPVKTQRQSGLLFPKFRFGTVHGFQYIQPFFWAISRSLDVTLGFGKLTARGYKGELQHRYALGSRSFGQTDLFMLQDRTMETIRCIQTECSPPSATICGNRFGWFPAVFGYRSPTKRSIPFTPNRSSVNSNPTPRMRSFLRVRLVALNWILVRCH